MARSHAHTPKCGSTFFQRGRILTLQASTKPGADPVPGIAVFPHPNVDSTPLALRANVEHNHVLHERVLIVAVDVLRVPYAPASEAFTYDDLGYSDDGIEHITIHCGFSEAPDVPHALQAPGSAGVLNLEAAQLNDATYFISRGAIRTASSGGMGLIAFDGVVGV